MASSPLHRIALRIVSGCRTTANTPASHRRILHAKAERARLFARHCVIESLRALKRLLPTCSVFRQTVRSMNRSHLLAAIIFLCLSSLISAQSVELNGLWLGYEPFKYKGDDWFYENLLSIKDGVVHLVKKPETRADDGNIVEYASGSCGFPVFRGRLVARGNVTVAVLEIESCDECDDAGKK